MNLSRPNVILIILDTVRADHLSCYGYRRQTTPFIDSLAAEGVLFKQAISPSSWSLPAHVSLFTGLYPSEHHFWQIGDSSRHRLPPTITRLLAGSGYQTVGFSANPWLTESGLDQQFNDFYENYKAGQSYQGRLQRVMRRRWNHLQIGFDRLFFRGDKGAEWLNDRVRYWLGNVRSDDQPFFMFINYMEAHFPYVPPKPYHRTYAKRPLKSVILMQRMLSRLATYLDCSQSIAPHHRNDFIDLYDGEIAYLDKQISVLVDSLKHAIDLENAILIITSDHGDNFGEHSLNGRPLMLHQFSIHDTLIRVPLIVFAPAFAYSRQVSSAVSLVDIAPTIAELVSTSPLVPDSFHLLRPKPTRVVKSEYKTPSNTLAKLENYARRLNCPVDLTLFDLNLTAVRDGQHKLVVSGHDDFRFYDIMTDFLEQEPLDTSRLSLERKQVYDLFTRNYDEWVKYRSALTGSDADRLSDPDQSVIEERLRMLGYL